VDVVFAGTVDEVSQNTPEFIFHAKMDDVDMFWSNCETMTCADKESNQVGAYIQLLRTLRAATITVGGRIATGRNGALCKRTRDPRETHAGRHQDMIILCGLDFDYAHNHIYACRS
jgi:hypothetical protein